MIVSHIVITNPLIWMSFVFMFVSNQLCKNNIGKMLSLKKVWKLGQTLSRNLVRNLHFILCFKSDYFFTVAIYDDKI